MLNVSYCVSYCVALAGRPSASLSQRAVRRREGVGVAVRGGDVKSAIPIVIPHNDYWL